MSSKALAQADFMELERRDEEQILAEIQGKVLEEMFYQFPGQGGKLVTGVSWMGMKMIAREYGNVKTKMQHFEDIGEAFMVVVEAMDLESGTSMIGASTQDKLMKQWIYENKQRTDRFEMIPDKFAVQKAFSKAQRNAIRTLIPEAYFRQMLAAWAEQKRLAEAGVQDKLAQDRAKRAAKAQPERKEVESEQREVQPLSEDEVEEAVEQPEEEPPEESPNIADAMKLPDAVEAKFVELEAALEAESVATLHLVDIEKGIPLVISPKKFLGDLWGPTNDAIVSLGGRWIREGRQSRWEIRV